ncbi:uncharacterized protein ASPGLDRAFT_80025 [Aspergillus glaucus CBS 516.65]|uniref:NACHT domain-containing protein n=1 Tax=Aspergillus glaucus CBS 516.65 TaxID=1160497 RepID=A0A1L9VT82_ASPGL|nr:hypothetical protein ASPGLDRAFT_80025 [Aspergillus glaucus CBS 516.65]OJJ87138.1 hypothetical protein ASPGLDRAFT_80025 [Aspergillus glaucus CBS 516.65]
MTMIDNYGLKTFLRTLVPGEKPNIDIVAIHGLNPKNKENHAERTWESGGKLWLRDFLPKKLPQARIFLYGYNSNVAIQSSAAGIRDQAQNLLSRLWLERKGCETRPILFIAHSLGGIVVKEALVQAKLGDVYSSIFKATFGVVFFGTPHRGSPLARIGDVFAKVARAVLNTPNNTFMNALKKDDLYATELSSNFQQIQEQYQYLNFYETLPLKSFNLIVEKSSAVLGLPDTREKKIALNANHEEICRFASEDDENYRHVSAFLVDLVKTRMDFEEQSIVESFNSLSSTLMDGLVEEREPSFFMVPYMRNEVFVNRGPIIEKLKDRILPIGESHSRVALFGLGGVGKSQVAIEIAYQMHTELPHVSVFWIHANSIERFREGYHNIIDECNIPGRNEENCDKMALFKYWLEKEHKEWLLIIDNADEASLFASKAELSREKTGADQSILQYLPESPHGSILITTRNRAAGVKFTRNLSPELVEVNTMTEDESSRLIRSALLDDIPTDEEIYEISDLLGHLPLALAQATAFMQENVLTISEYIELYKDSDETQMDLLSEPFETLGRDSQVPNAVTTTLIISINQIKKKDPKAIDILSLVAFIDQHDIPKSLIQAKVKRPLDFTKALGTLKAFSLITANERGNFSLHRLVQLVLRKWLIIEDKFEDQAIQAMDVLAELFPNAKFEHLAICKAHFTHAFSVLKFIPELHGKLLRRRLYLQEGIAFYLWTQGYYDEAEKLDLLIVEENVKEFGMEHPETLESFESLAATYEQQARWSEAARLDQHVLEVRERTLGPTHDLTLTIKSCLAKLYSKQGRHEEAETMVMDVLKTRQSILGADHKYTITTMANLGIICRRMDKFEQAEKFMHHAWDWRKKNLGVDHEDTLDVASTLAVIYTDQNELQKAEQLTLQTLEAQGRQLGPKHPATLITKGNLVSIYQSMEEWKKAEELARNVTKDHIELLGPSHYETLLEKQKLVDIYLQQGFVEQSDALGDEVTRDSIRRLGLDHPFTIECMHDTAITRKRQSRDAEAIQLMIKVVNWREKSLGPYHDDTLMPFKMLCDWCGADEAIEMLLDAAEMR